MVCWFDSCNVCLILICGGRLRPLLPVSNECPGKNEMSRNFLEVVVVSDYPCCVRQVFEWELTLVVWRFPRELHCLELYWGRKGPVEGTLKNITSTSLPKIRAWSESLLCMSADSPASAATHLQWLRDPPHCFSFCSCQVWVLPGDLLRREIRREWGAGLRSPSICVWQAEWPLASGKCDVCGGWAFVYLGIFIMDRSRHSHMSKMTKASRWFLVVKIMTWPSMTVFSLQVVWKY